MRDSHKFLEQTIKGRGFRFGNQYHFTYDNKRVNYARSK